MLDSPLPGPADAAALAVVAGSKVIKAGVKGIIKYGDEVADGVKTVGKAGDDVVGDGIKKIVTISKKKYGEAADHIDDAIRDGHPDILTIDRVNTNSNRSLSLKGYDKVKGKDLDEYPPAMFKEGGSNASVRAIDPAANRGAGACIGNACRGLDNGDKIKIVVTND